MSKRKIDLQDSKETPKAVCFYDCSQGRQLHLSSKILEEPFARPIVLVRPGFFGRKDQMMWQVVKATGQESANYFGMYASHFGRQDQAGHEELFALCKTVVVSDGCLCSDEADHGLAKAMTWASTGQLLQYCQGHDLGQHWSTFTVLPRP